MKTRKNLVLLVLALGICLNLFVLFYVYKWNTGQTCSCAVDKKLGMIKAYLGTTICIDLFMLFLFITRYGTFQKYVRHVFMCIIPFSIAYTYLTYLYIQQLKAASCTCIAPFYMDLVYIVSLLTTIIFSVTGLFLVFGGILFYSMVKK